MEKKERGNKGDRGFEERNKKKGAMVYIRRWGMQRNDDDGDDEGMKGGRGEE